MSGVDKNKAGFEGGRGAWKQVMRGLEPQLAKVKGEVGRLREEQQLRQTALEQAMADYTAARAERAERLASNLTSTTSIGGPLQMTSAFPPPHSPAAPPLLSAPHLLSLKPAPSLCI